LVDNRGKLLGFLALLVVLEGGKAVSYQLLHEPALERMTGEYAYALHSLGYIGPLNLNCKKMGPDQFMAYELNGRFTGATAARAMLGYPEVEYALDYFLDGRLPDKKEELHLHLRKMGTLSPMVQRLPGAYYIDPDDVIRLKQNGVWHKSLI
jgi:hypothetical protein